MSFTVQFGRSFVKEAKALKKRYDSLKSEVNELVEHLERTPFLHATPIGKGCCRIRIAIASKGKGKSGGARVITCVKVLQDRVILLSINDKSEQ